MIPGSRAANQGRAAYSSMYMEVPSSELPIERVADVLRATYHDFDHYNKKNPLDELLFILGSTCTPESRYRATFRSLKRAFPTFASMAAASVEAVAEPLTVGGMQRQKARLILSILAAIKARFGRPTLGPLRRMSDAECELTLTSLPGIGKKIARCVMMYSWARQVFPVDTHCWRVCNRLGWVASGQIQSACSPKDMDRLQSVIPPQLRFSLHVNLVSHGRACCKALTPACGSCPITALCPKVGVKFHTIPVSTSIGAPAL